MPHRVHLPACRIPAINLLTPVFSHGGFTKGHCAHPLARHDKREQPIYLLLHKRCHCNSAPPPLLAHLDTAQTSVEAATT